MVRDPEDFPFLEIVDGFDDADGEPVLLVKEVSEDEETAVSTEELFDTFGEVFVFVIPKGGIVERTTKARIAERAGVNFAALSRARQEYALMLSHPGEGHFKNLGKALNEVWD